jgi:hypothetical protein
MPINTVQSRLKSILDGLALPQNFGILQAYISPPNPNVDSYDPAAYIWGSHGNESRMTVPRAQPGNLASGGNKELIHQVSIWLVWFGKATGPTVDVAFPAIVDAVLACLRNTELLDAVTIHAVDPVTGQLSDLLNIGENMSWDYAAVRAVADQRYFRYDAEITCEVIEIIQA